MVGRIPHEFIQTLLARTDIVEIINYRLHLKKSGKYYRTCCPFHNDHTPSFIVNKERQFFYCFGCGKNGNAIDFIMNFDGLNFVETIQYLAKIYGIEVEYENNSSYQIKLSYHQKLYFLMKEVTKFYQNSLWRNTAKGARKYLIQRGIRRGIIEDYCIGYAPANVNILNYLGRDYFNNLIKVGIIVTKSYKTYYNFFRERIIFPIRDQYGRVLGFGGRSLNHNTYPKYLNSPHTILFNKSRQLYGIYELYKKCSKNSCILVVEGYMDVIALAQAGIYYTVALLGTSTSREQIQYLFRISNHIIYCYDGDYAGRNAAWSALETTLEYMFDGYELSFIFLPDGEDPESLIRKEGKIIFEQRIQYAQSFYDFMFYTLTQKINLSCIEGKAKLSSIVLPLIKKIPGDTLRLSLYQLLGQKLGIFDYTKLVNLANKPRATLLKYGLKLTYTPMRILITLLLQNPYLSTIVPDVETLTYIKNVDGLSIFIELVKTCRSYSQITTGQLLELYRNTKIIKYLQILSVWNHMIIDREVENTFKDALTNIYNLVLKQRQDKLIAIERSKGLNIDDRRELWDLNKALAKKSKII
ncbi:MAG: DNA primase [Candidatus Dasytiphilus stammeri]